MVRTLRPHALACLGIGVLLLALSAYGGDASAQTSQSQVLVAAVIDTKDQSTTVSGLRARYYRDSRDTPGPILGTVRTPGKEETAAEIRIDLEFKEGRTTWHEPIRIPMNSMRLLSMESRSIAPFPPEKVVLQQRDGSTIQLSKAGVGVPFFDTFDERDSQGALKRTFRPGSGQITVRATLGLDDFRLVGFEGSARVSTGAEGSFSIGLNEVRRIEFK